jgi:hypothetical protein
MCHVYRVFSFICGVTKMKCIGRQPGAHCLLRSEPLSQLFSKYFLDRMWRFYLTFVYMQPAAAIRYELLPCKGAQASSFNFTTRPTISRFDPFDEMCVLPGTDQSRTPS